MRAELLKIRSMPTPRWCLLAVAVAALLGIAITWRWGLGSELEAVDLAIGFPAAIASIVFGVWLFGVEYGQNTLRRTLTADPRRFRLFLAKLVVGLLLVALATVAIYLVAFPFYDIAADRHGESVGIAEYRDLVLTALIGNLVYMVVGASLALITASMAGGVTAALVFIFIFDIVFGAIPGVGDFGLGVALADVVDSIRGTGSSVGDFDTGHSTATAAGILAAWVFGLAALGWLRLWRSEVK